VPRMLLYVPAVVAALAVTVLACNVADPNVGRIATAPPATSAPATAAPAPSVGVTPNTEVAACKPDELRVYDFRDVGGTSVNTGISLLKLGPPTCALDSYPTMVLRGADGAELARSVAQESGRINLRLDWIFHSILSVASWCDASTALPLSLELVVNGAAAQIEGWIVEDVGDLPACAEDTGTSLTATKWKGNP